MSKSRISPTLLSRPWFAFFSSMRFAVALLSLLGIASVIGTVLQQNQPQTDYLVKFGPFGLGFLIFWVVRCLCFGMVCRYHDVSGGFYQFVFNP